MPDGVKHIYNKLRKHKQLKSQGGLDHPKELIHHQPLHDKKLMVFAGACNVSFKYNQLGLVVVSVQPGNPEALINGFGS